MAKDKLLWIVEVNIEARVYILYQIIKMDFYQHPAD